MSIINSYKPKESGGTILTNRAVGSLVIMSKEIENPEPKYINIGVSSSNSVYVIPSDYPKLANVYNSVLRESTTPILVDYISIANNVDPSDLALGVIREGESYRYFTLENLDINTIQYIGDVHYDSNIVNPFYCNGRYYFLTASRTISTINADNLSNITTESVSITGIEIADDNIATFSITYHPGVNKYYAINNSTPCIMDGIIRDNYRTIHISDDGINFTSSYDIEFSWSNDSYSYAEYTLTSIVYVNGKLYVLGKGLTTNGHYHILLLDSTDGITWNRTGILSNGSINCGLLVQGSYIYFGQPSSGLCNIHSYEGVVYDYLQQENLRTLTESAFFDADRTNSIIITSNNIVATDNIHYDIDLISGVEIYGDKVIDTRFPILEDKFDPISSEDDKFIFISSGENILGIITSLTNTTKYSNFMYFTKLLSAYKFFDYGSSSTGYTKRYYIYTGEEE